MEIKKNPKANLEKYKLMFLAIGLIISIGVLVSAFNWSSTSAKSDLVVNQNIEEEDMVEITRQDQKKPPPPPQQQQQQQTIEVINIIDNNEDVNDDVELNLEFDENEDIDLEDTNNGEEDQIFLYVKNMPEFPGGVVALKRYIATHVVYPAIARENGIEGTVFLRFEVTKTGKIGKVELQKGVDPLLDNEAIKVIKSLPRFKPGEQNGKKVSVWFSIPVTFKLN
ncbi:MAG: energy transducer TonB [Bacteroidales bacterium]|nr:energy transducer TonB [Bacteroidales bacterium]